MKAGFSMAVALLAAMLFSGCATHRPASTPSPAYGAQSANYVQYGVVQDVETVNARNQTSGAGAVIGGVIGAVIGHQIDSGARKDFATGVGIVGGAIIGNEIEKNRAGARDLFRVSIRLESGATRVIDVPQIGDLRIGDRVRIDNDQIQRY
jgi:outer membrane lipoprotein SlyB